MAAGERSQQVALVSIGHLAEATGVSSRTIRYYEELGILPAPPRSPGGTRKYPPEFVSYLRGALALKELGFSLEEIKPLARLAGGRTLSQAQRTKAAQVVEDRIKVLEQQTDVLRSLHKALEHGEAMPLRGVLEFVKIG